MSNTSTKGIVVHEPGGPEKLVWEDIPMPADLKDGEIRIKHTAIGVNFIDVYFRKGLYKPPNGYPFIPGMEAAGVVTAVGPGLTGRKVGDRVAYAGRPIGAYSEERVIPADRVVPLPENLDDKTAAAAMLKGMTADILVRRVFKVEAGHTILVHAAAGGVGSILCQWAAALGANVIGTVGSDEKAEQAKQNGCHYPIVYTRENFLDRVMEITKGQGVNAVYDSVGKETFQQSLDSLAPLGMLVSFGQSSGAPDPVPLTELAKKSLFLTRPSLMDYTAKREDLLASAGELFQQIVSGVVNVRIGATFPLKEAKAAHEALEARKTTGSTILLP